MPLIHHDLQQQYTRTPSLFAQTPPLSTDKHGLRGGRRYPALEAARSYGISLTDCWFMPALAAASYCASCADARRPEAIIATGNKIHNGSKNPELHEILGNSTTLAAFAFLVSTMKIYHAGLSERYQSPLLLAGISGSILLSWILGTSAQFFLQALLPLWVLLAFLVSRIQERYIRYLRSNVITSFGPDRKFGIDAHIDSGSTNLDP